MSPEDQAWNEFLEKNADLRRDILVGLHRGREAMQFGKNIWELLNYKPTYTVRQRGMGRPPTRGISEFYLPGAFG